MNTPRLISFSGGRSSAYMTKILIDQGLTKDDHIVFANTGKEREETLQFVDQCQKYWQVKIHWLEYSGKKTYKAVNYDTASRNGEPFEMLIEEKQFLPKVVARFCTADLKVRPMKKFMEKLGYSIWHVQLGIRYDEPLRWQKLMNSQKKEKFFYEMPLYENKITVNEVKQFWKSQPFDLQIDSIYGNCDLCFLKRKTKLLRIIHEFPDQADWWIKQEEKIGGTFNQFRTYAELKKVATTQLEIEFDAAEIDYPCHCNID